MIWLRLDVPDDPYFTRQRCAAISRKRCCNISDVMEAHRLKREIICTVLANRIVDIAGPVFLLRLREQSGAANADIVAAFRSRAGPAGHLHLKLRKSMSWTIRCRRSAPKRLCRRAWQRRLRRLTHSILTAHAGLYRSKRRSRLQPNKTALSEIEIEICLLMRKHVQAPDQSSRPRRRPDGSCRIAVASTRLLADAPLITQLAEECGEVARMRARRSAYLRLATLCRWIACAQRRRRRSPTCHIGTAGDPRPDPRTGTACKPMQHNLR